MDCFRQKKSRSKIIENIGVSMESIKEFLDDINYENFEQFSLEEYEKELIRFEEFLDSVYNRS